jgi:sugar/nucleoside kinase (ribokinase family)
MFHDAAPRDAAVDEGSAPDYLIVGTITRDVVPGGYVPGGTVTYAGNTAAALGAKVAAVASVGPDVSLCETMPGIPVRVRPALVTTTFENVYRDGHRTQWLRGLALSLDLALIPPAWREAPIAHLAPLVDDVDVDIIDGLSHVDLLGLTPQGWLRAWDEHGRVRRSSFRQPEALLSRFDAVVLSEEDVEQDWNLIERWSRLSPLLVATQGSLGCTVFDRGRRWRIPAFPVEEVDATGAGDVFAAAFFIRFRESGDPIVAARFANCVASFAVEVLGPPRVISLTDVERRLSQATAAAVRE